MTTKPTIIFALNNFGSGGHPMATAETLDFFGAAYVRECLEKMLADSRINESGRAAATAALASLSAS